MRSCSGARASESLRFKCMIRRKQQRRFVRVFPVWTTGAGDFSRQPSVKPVLSPLPLTPGTTSPTTRFDYHLYSIFVSCSFDVFLIRRIC